MNGQAISLDIGSTYTKGALFALGPSPPRMLCRDAVPTTVERLTEGVETLVDRLQTNPCGKASDDAEQDIPLYACSSAKGGLTIAALGLVPDLTLHVARLAAASAGGKVVAHYAYCLTDRHMAELERLQPDILLFCGGTDGGNQRYVIANAGRLAQSSLRSTIIYCGNSAVGDEVRRILFQKEVWVIGNLMPEIGELQIEHARQCIQDIFLRRIVEGKGLAEVQQRCVAEMKPTPRAVYDLLDVLWRRSPQWDNTVWIDLGGATTDVYSCTESFHGEESFVLRGIREPKLKRTVEGDLGLRVNAISVMETAENYLEAETARRGIPMERVADYAAAVHADSTHLPDDLEERQCDDLLAGACVYHALLRHAGRIEEHCTIQGKVHVQHGKDLRYANKWIGAGGYLARCESADLYRNAVAAAGRDSGGTALLPRPDQFFADVHHVLPLLGNLVGNYPDEVIRLVTTCTQPIV
jgi:uncharacterized protein (TIGR01319 family)